MGGLSAIPNLDHYDKQCPSVVAFEPGTLRVGSKPEGQCLKPETDQFKYKHR
jgi:hypothetical protein